MIWLQSILGEDCLICGVDGTEGEGINIGILFGGLDDLV